MVAGGLVKGKLERIWNEMFKE